ncbi:hypothetical protein C1645_812793 [Glomus cerebriforme]|uniref:Uncharacterized protein n=1 Tax=Glomus cerebriforme TaxID=658196 RepID=A0A397TK84_9GLOM|nr:hypothetical protein C1645_812793 [Glomus cerebriforme]
MENKVKRSSYDKNMGNDIKEYKKLLQAVSTHIRDNKPNRKCVKKVGKLEGITNKIHEGVEQQINETNTFIPIAEQHLNLTKQLQKDLEAIQTQVRLMNILCEYRDWIGDFLREVVQKMRLKSVDEFIQTLYTIGFFEEDGEQEDEQKNEVIENEELEDEEDEEQQGDDEILTNLKNILQKVDMTLSDFKVLLKMRDLSNSRFHRADSSQKPKEAEIKLDKTKVPEEIAYIKPPLKKSLHALGLWRHNKKLRNKRNKRQS